jgi:hypothetical protein
LGILIGSPVSLWMSLATEAAWNVESTGWPVCG